MGKDKYKAPPPLSPEEDLDQQLVRSEEELIQVIKEQQLLNHEMEALKNDIKEFEDVYHEAVGSLLEELDDLEHRLNGTASEPVAVAAGAEHVPMIPIPGEPKEMTTSEVKLADAEDEKRHDAAIEKESKRLYRKLVKKVHPDSAKDEPEADAAFSILKTSHEKNDLSTLMLLERTLERDDTVPKLTQLESLRQQMDVVIKQNDKLKLERHKLLHSDSYTLKIRALNAKLEGKDLLKTIALSIQAQVDEKRKLLQTARYQS